MNKLQQKLNLVFISLFMIILLVPTLTLNFKADQTSLFDNRKLKEFPTLTQNTEFFAYISDLASYFQDRIGFRTAMITFSQILQDKFFGVLSHPTYDNGKDGYVFFKVKPQLTDYSYVHNFAAFASKLQTYCTERGADFLLSIDPNKQIVYQQYLPNGVNYRNDRINLLLKDLTKNNVNHVYTATALIEASKTMQVYNVKYDAGHWNDNGAFVGISLMLQTLKKDYPLLTLPSKSDYDITHVLHTSLPLSDYPIHEEDVFYTPKKLQAVEANTYKGEIRVNPTGWYYSYSFNPSKPKAPKILVFMGSYFEGREKFIADSFSETVFVHSYKNVQDFDYYFNIFQPDIVLFQTADYATTNDYYPQNLIDNANFNPGYNTLKSLPLLNFANVIKNTKQEILNTSKNSKTLLTHFSINLTGDKVSYAYAQIDDKTYDFIVNTSGNQQTINITLDKNTILSAKHLQIILISADKKHQNIITL